MVNNELKVVYKTVGNDDMAGHKVVMASQMYRQKGQFSTMHAHDKAAKITGSCLPEKLPHHRDRWGDILQLYCDYFIRY